MDEKSLLKRQYILYDGCNRFDYYKTEEMLIFEITNHEVYSYTKYDLIRRGWKHMMIKYELVKKLIYEIIDDLEQEEKEIKRDLQAHDYTIQGYTQEIDD